MAEPKQKTMPPRSGAKRASQDRVASPVGIRAVIGIGLLLLAFLLWEVRDVVPGWAAQDVTVNVDLATTTERDDARVGRAFESAMHAVAADARLEVLPKQTRVRHTRVTVRARSSAEAVSQASAVAGAMAAAFARDGEGILYTDVRRRTVPVPDGTTVFLGAALRIGAAGAGVLGLALVGFAWLRFQAGPDRLPMQFWLVPAVGVLVPLAVLLPGEIVVALMIMAIPLLISGAVVWKTTQLRHAASWPSTRARIVKSELRARHRRHAGEVSQVINVPDIEYEFSLGDRTIRGTRIGIGETTGPDEALNRYPVGAAVPVYYNPKDPQDAVLERDPPVAVVWLYLIAAAVVVVGLGVIAVVENGTALLDRLEGYFPANAFVPGMLFFALGGVMVLAMLWAARQQAIAASRWPATGGRIVSSTVEHYRAHAGRAGAGGSTTFYEPVVEYSYRLDGREYHSTQLSFGGKVAGSEEAAKTRAARYTAGSDVVVHYDPNNPANAVLDPKVAYGGAFLLIALLFFELAVFFSGAFR